MITWASLNAQPLPQVNSVTDAKQTNVLKLLGALSVSPTVTDYQYGKDKRLSIFELCMDTDDTNRTDIYQYYIYAYCLVFRHIVKGIH